MVMHTVKSKIIEENHPGKFKIFYMSNIIGYYGCSCHPFNSWEECEFRHSQKFKYSDVVRNRHNQNQGTVIRICEDKGFYIIKYGKNRSDEHLEHAANLLPQNQLELNFNYNARAL